jgi:hypothetical protein
MKLHEAYEDRLQQIVSAIAKAHDKVKKDELKKLVHTAALNINAVEIKSEKLFKELLTDVYSALKKQGKIASAQKAKPAYTVIDKYGDQIPVSEDDIRALAFKIQAAAGDSFPDGDPIDSIMVWARKKGWDSYGLGDLLDVATKKYLGANSYNDYLADLYDDFTQDNPGMYDLNPNQNPWRSTKESVNESAEINRLLQLSGIKLFETKK